MQNLGVKQSELWAIGKYRMSKSIHGFPFLSYMGMDIRLAALPAARARLQTLKIPTKLTKIATIIFSQW